MSKSGYLSGSVGVDLVKSTGVVTRVLVPGHQDKGPSLWHPWLPELKMSGSVH